MSIIVQESYRKKKRDLAYALGDDLLRYIAELLTNADDSYRRLETEGKVDANAVKTIYIELKEDRRNQGNDMIIVTDNAEGMSKDSLERIFRVYGEDNAGGVGSHSRGIFGQGASDVLSSASEERKTAKIESFKDGKLHKLLYHVDPTTLQKSIDVEEVEVRTSHEAGIRSHLRIPANGTSISFGIPNKVKYGPKIKNRLKKDIESYPSFRYILSQPNRKVVFIVNGEETILSSHQHTFNTMEFLTQNDFDFNFKGTKITCHLKSYKNKHKNDNLTDILVVDKNYSVFDNTMFDFANLNAAKNISGELLIDNLYDVCYENLNNRQSPNAIVNPNRTGFDTKNEFYKLLSKNIAPIIDSILKEHGDKTSNTDLTNNKRINEALKKLNKYIKNELKDTISGGNLNGQVAPAQGIKFVRPHITLTKGKTYDIKLLINTDLIKEDDKIIISSQNRDNISFTPTEIQYSKDDIVNGNLAVKNVTITSLEVTSEAAIIEADCGSFKTNVTVQVIELDIHYPENGLEFYPKETVSSVSETHKAFLYFDKNTIPLNSEIVIESDELETEEKITISQENLINDEIGCITIKSKGGNIGSDYKIKAIFGEKIAEVKITVVEPSKHENTGGGLISGIKLEANPDLFFQAYYQPHTHEIIINSKNPVNVAVMGSMDDKDPDNPRFDKNQMKYLCDIIANQAAQILVKTSNARKGEIEINGNSDDALDSLQALIQQHKNRMFVDIFPAMMNLTE